MELNQRKEAFSCAYVNAVAATCGWSVGTWNKDVQKIDVSLSKTITNPATKENFVLHLGFQLKCTASPTSDTEEFISFSLEDKHYEELSKRVGGKPMLLAVMAVPQNLEHWFSLIEKDSDDLHKATKLKFCGYLGFISDEAANYIGDKKTIRFYKGKDEFTSIALRQIEAKLSDLEYRKSTLKKQLERLELET